MFKKSIRFKLAFGLSGILIVAMLIIGIVFIGVFQNYVIESKQEDMLSRATEIAAIAERYVSTEGSMRGYGMFVQLMDTLAGARVWIIDANGDSVMSSGGMHGMMTSGARLPEDAAKVIRAVLSGEKTKTQSFSPLYDEATFTVGVPIRSGSGIIEGAVFLNAPITGMSQPTYKAFGILMMGILISALLSIGFIIYFSKRFTNPLKAMNSLAMEMTRGNYSIRTNINQEDEIGQLSHSLDSMAEKLGTSIEQLFQEKSKLNDIMGSISEGIMAFDNEMKLTSCNQAVIHIFDIGKNQDIKGAINQIVEDQRLSDAFHAVISGKEKDSFIWEWDKKKLRFTLAPLMNSQSENLGVVALVQDVSEAEKLEQMRKDFVANISHEFRTPLTLIRGSAESLLDGMVTEPEAVSQYHRRILAESKGLERLVKDLLELSRLQSGTVTLEIEPVDVGTLIRDVAKGLQPLADMKHISINSSIEIELPVILSDYDRIRQLLIIFLDNAIKYSQGNTQITIETAKSDDHIMISISDQGMGIPKEDLPYIWDRFYKADKSRSQSDKGTGLGLSIAKQLIGLLNGTIDLQSEQGIGTRIEIGLPMRKG